MAVMQPHLNGRKKALDAGCGSGFFSKSFCDAGLDTTSVDYSKEALELTRRITGGKSKVVKHDLLSKDLTRVVSERFDLIFSDGLLEHFSFEEQSQIVQNFKSLLNNNGVLITFVPNRWSPWELIRPFFMPGIHETPFILRNLVSLQVKNGLKVIEKNGINTLPFKFSPDKLLGRSFGMLLYTVAKKDE